MSLPPFEWVCAAHGESVLRFCIAAVGTQEAEDVFQETFAAALRAYTSLDRDANLRAWLLTIANHKAIDNHRARGRRPIVVARVPDEPLEPLRGDENGLWDAVRSLPPKQRAAVTHRFANDLTYADVAAVLGCSEEAARRSVHEGLKKLREVWRS